MPTKTTRDLRSLKAGGAEESPVTYPAGVYELVRDDGSVSTIVAKYHPLFGTVQADALVRVGYTFVRDATADDIIEQDAYAAPLAASKSSDSGVSRSEFEALQKQLADLQAEKAQAPAVLPDPTVIS